MPIGFSGIRENPKPHRVLDAAHSDSGSDSVSDSDSDTDDG